MKTINYPYAYGHLYGALHGHRLIKEMKLKGLDLKDVDLELTLETLLDDVLHELKQEVETAGQEQATSQSRYHCPI